MCYLSSNMSFFVPLCWQLWSGASYSTSAAGVWAATSKISTSTAAAAAAAAATSDTAAINSIWPARTCCWSEGKIPLFYYNNCILIPSSKPHFLLPPTFIGIEFGIVLVWIQIWPQPVLSWNKYLIAGRSFQNLLVNSQGHLFSLRKLHQLMNQNCLSSIRGS